MSWLDDLLIGIRKIRSGGSDVPHRQTINFIGGTVADNPTTGATDVTLGSGGGGNVVVWRPSGVTGGNVYTSFADACAACAAIDGPSTLFFDHGGSSTPMTIPAGSYNFGNDCSLVGKMAPLDVYYFGPSVVPAAGVTFATLPARVVAIEFDLSSLTGPLISLSTPSVGNWTLLIEDAEIYSGGSVGAFFTTPAQLDLAVYGETYLGQNTFAVGGAQIYAYGGQIDSNTFACSSDIIVYVRQGGANVRPTANSVAATVYSGSWLLDLDYMGAHSFGPTSQRPTVGAEAPVRYYDTDLDAQLVYSPVTNTWKQLGSPVVDITWQPGGTAGGNVYTSWSAACAAAAAVGGYCNLWIDDRFGSPNIPAGSWDFGTRTALRGIGKPGVPSTTDRTPLYFTNAGTSFVYSPIAIFNLFFEGGIGTSLITQAPLGGQLVLHNAEIDNISGNHHVWDVGVNAMAILMHAGSRVWKSSSQSTFKSLSAIDVYLFDNARIDNGAFEGASVDLHIQSSDATPGSALPLAQTGSLTLYTPCLKPYGTLSKGATSDRPSAGLVTGAEWYNTTTAQLEVWNGSAWAAVVALSSGPVVFDGGGTHENLRSSRATHQSPIDNTKQGIVNLGTSDGTFGTGATADYAAILGGYENTASAAHAIATGNRGRAIRAGQRSHGKNSGQQDGVLLMSANGTGILNVIDNDGLEFVLEDTHHYNLEIRVTIYRVSPPGLTIASFIHNVLCYRSSGTAVIADDSVVRSFPNGTGYTLTISITGGTTLRVQANTGTDTCGVIAQYRWLEGQGLA